MASRKQKKSGAGSSAEERRIQDGAAASSCGSEKRDWRRESALKLEKYARSSQLASRDALKTPKAPSAGQSPGGSRYLPLAEQEEEVSGEEEEVMEERAAALIVQESDADAAKTAEPTLSDLLRAINKCDTSISQVACQMGSIKEEISFIRHDLQKVTERTAAVEQRVSTVEDAMLPLRRDVNAHSQAVSELFAKADDLENRLRRNNVRLVGVPEKVEGRDPDGFFERWIKEIIGTDALTPLYAVERAHRVPTRPGPPGRPPRPVLVKVLHYKDRDIILRKARELQEIKIDGCRVSFYPDYSVVVQKKRAQFVDIKRRLRNLGVTYSMIYPAKLRVAAMGSVHFFEAPADALRWVDVHEEQLRQLGNNRQPPIQGE